MSKYGAPTDFNFGANAKSEQSPEAPKEDYRGRDPPTYACVGRVECKSCGHFFGYHDAVPDMLREIETLKDLIRDRGIEDRPPMDLKSHRSKDRPGKSQKFARRPFLKAKDIPARGMKCKIIDFRTAPKQMEYSDFLLDVANGKKEFTVGLRSQTVLLDMLMDELGTKTEKWPGKTVRFVKGGAKGQYVNVG